MTAEYGTAVLVVDAPSAHVAGMRAAVIEDQTLVRDYLAALLHRHFDPVEVIAISSMAELRARNSELANLNLVLMDIDLGDGSTLDWALERVHTGTPGAIVALSSISAMFPFKKLQVAGISLVHKNDPEGELLEIIRQTLSGALMLSKRAMALIAAGNRDPHSPLKLLGEKEQQVLALLGQRLSNHEIAAMLGCTPATAADHRKRIMRKLDLHRIEDVIDYAIRHGVIYESSAAGARVTFRRDGGQPWP